MAFLAYRCELGLSPVGNFSTMRAGFVVRFVFVMLLGWQETGGGTYWKEMETDDDTSNS